MDEFNNNNQPEDNQQPQGQETNPYDQQPQGQQSQMDPYAQGYQPQDSYAQQPAYYQQPDQQMNYYPQPVQQGKSGMSIASMVLGILSLVLFCAWYLSGPMAIISLILGIISLNKKKPGKGMAIAGIICSGIGFIIAIIMMIIAINIMSNPEYSSPDFWSSWIQENT